jgi:hypothetical protein
MIFRILGAFLLILGTLIAVMVFISFFLIGTFETVIFVVFYSVPLTVLGILFFAASRKLAKWVCFDFDRFNEQK